MQTFRKPTFKLAALAVLGISSVIGGTFSANAAPGKMGGHKRGGMNMMRIAQKLNLSDAQKAQLKSIFENSRTQSQQIRGNSSLDAQQKRDRLKIISKSTRDSALNVLTPQQQAQLKQIEAKQRNRRRNWMQDLNLSDAQKTQLKTIRQRAQADQKAVKANTALTPEQKRARLQTIRKQEREASTLVLTPEQQAKIKQAMGAHGQRGQRQRPQSGGWNN